MDPENQAPTSVDDFARQMQAMQARNRNGLPRELTTEEHAKLAAEELRKRLAPEPCVPDGRLTPIGSIHMRLSVNLRSPAMTHVVAHTLPAVRDFIAVAVKSPELFAAEDVFGALEVLVWCRAARVFSRQTSLGWQRKRGSV